MRYATAKRASELNIKAVDIEFVHEGTTITAVIVRDPVTKAEIQIKKSDAYGEGLKVLQREDHEKATRYRLSGAVTKGVGVLEYFESDWDAQERMREIRAEAPKATVEVEKVEVYLDEQGEVLAEIAQAKAADEPPF